eukprot:CAMPEP_0114514474 /NCGR_PEP_ID=MMETSP0109-20121206/16175_1 /TAXON_ID=29199 /ORGANISM="Chlorarachnion reptans, Strain CCCM449" /LENGTH=207 /DNA_ID=CAMNT_0001694521 /DNA_START=265 /DNA_END=888 /DNA_ORIENTATION=+
MIKVSLENGGNESSALKAIREYTKTVPRSRMLLDPVEGQFLALLARIIQAKKTVDVGVYTGYSACAVAEALPGNGTVFAFDIEKRDSCIKHWGMAGVAHKIDYRIAPAKESLESLIKEGHAGSIDMVFIDADKVGYDAYYELGLKLLRPGGLVVFDNMLWDGKVADPKDQRSSTNALRAMNEKVGKDQRVHCSLLKVGDGVMLAMKK